MQTSKYQTPLSWAIWLIIASYQFQCKSPLDLSSPSYKLLRYPIMGLFPLPDSTQFKWVSLGACQPPDLAQPQISRCFLAPFHWDASELSMVGVLVHSSRHSPLYSTTVGFPELQGVWVFGAPFWHDGALWRSGEGEARRNPQWWWEGCSLYKF